MSELIDKEVQEIEHYANSIYARKVPKPKKQNTSFWNLVGIDAVLFTITAIASAVLSSIRTGGLFYILEQELLKEYSISTNVSDILSFLALITSLLAFEGFLLAVGFSKGRRNNDVTISKVGITLAFIVVLFAGAFSGLGIVLIPEAIRNNINLTLAIVTAVSSAFITYFGGENIGYSFALYEKTKKKINDTHANEMADWFTSATRSYQSSKYYRQDKYRKNEIEEIKEVEEDQEEEDHSYHYRRDVASGMTTEEKVKMWEQGKASLKNKFPGLSAVQESRWWSNLERDLIELGVLEETVINSDGKEDW